MRLYTRTGDTGETGLLGEGRVPKDALRIEVVGSLDELNAWIGLAGTATEDRWVREVLEGVQRDLLAIGAQVADVRPEGRGTDVKVGVAAEKVGDLERAIDRVETDVAHLSRFILPGGCEPAARLHVARSVCRRAERRLVALARQERVAPGLLPYLNRLSDLLFALARRANQQAHTPETTW
ncbi:MAG TPA: cob(I)yrinic acid a,c-diamide adenosyltransferase [Candidatus Sulfotelmatobacter sp.]|nr:cob(I)yrinic acid a,c-diamide adenosyltransferase [Candidatus Sulfotelmatobacter sp.]